ncbi:SHSP domain-containing protein [Caenorhabditis elegans]|nr:SHSP domain-containing protein [Caenorhabditis elegans]CCW45983.1 SHSP domain-containing protein [Caenorhabditis elegans]|eukprot:NP_001294695.1 Uncharacterized protein CELE_F08H9.4 [Caenorhabditis elegans]
MNSNDKFAVNLNVSNFKPEELKVNLEGRQLSIQGEHDVENEHGASRKSFSRMILLPEDVDITSVATNLSNDGKLCIEAPKLEGVCGRSVPVKEASMDHHHIE